MNENSPMDLPAIKGSNSEEIMSSTDKDDFFNVLAQKKFEDDFDFEEATVEVKNDSYLNRIINDFDQRKNYEEVVLKILNFYQRSPQKHPAYYENFA